MMLFAKILSLLASPPVILLPASFLLIYSAAKDYDHALRWTGFSFIFVLMLVILLVIGVRVGIFSNMAISNRKQRPIFFLFSMIVLSFYAFSVMILNGPKILLFSSLYLAFALVILDIVNMKIKASIHVAAVTSFILLFSLLYGVAYFFIAIPFVFLLGWSRVKMKRHTKTEVFVGGFWGVTLTMIFYAVARQFLV